MPKTYKELLKTGILPLPKSLKNHKNMLGGHEWNYGANGKLRLGPSKHYEQ